MYNYNTVIENTQLQEMEIMKQMIDFSTITACGECCTGCKKKTTANICHTLESRYCRTFKRACKTVPGTARGVKALGGLRECRN